MPWEIRVYILPIFCCLTEINSRVTCKTGIYAQKTCTPFALTGYQAHGWVMTVSVDFNISHKYSWTMLSLCLYNLDGTQKEFKLSLIGLSLCRKSWNANFKCKFCFFERLAKLELCSVVLPTFWVFKMH